MTLVSKEFFRKITKPGRVTLIGGRPGIGKTSFCLNLVDKLCKLKKSVLYITFEVDEDSLRDHLLTIKSGITEDILSCKAYIGQQNITELRKTIDEIDDFSLHVYALKPGVDYINFVNSYRIIVEILHILKYFKCDAVFIDWLSLVGGKERMETFLFHLKSIAFKENTSFILVDMIEKNKHPYPNNTPCLEDLREHQKSAIIDHYLFLNRKNYYDNTEHFNELEVHFHDIHENHFYMHHGIPYSDSWFIK